MRIEAEDAITQVFFEAGHHRQDDIERHHANHHANHGDSGDQRDERLAPLGPQIAQADEEFVTHRLWVLGARCWVLVKNEPLTPSPQPSIPTSSPAASAGRGSRRGSRASW